jgi:hypothetical protein
VLYRVYYLYFDLVAEQYLATETFLKNPPPKLTWATFAQPLGATAAFLMPPLELTRASPFARTLELAVVETARLKLLPRCLYQHPWSRTAHASL